jgi:hypothetical protein
MKFATLFALMGLSSTIQLDEQVLADIQSFENSLAALAANPNTLTTSYMKQARTQIEDLYKKAQAEEKKNNIAKVAEYKKQIKEIEAKIKEIESADEPPKLALMELKSTYKCSSQWDKNWCSPMLDSKTGFHQG